MINLVMHRILVELEDLKRSHEVMTPNGPVKIDLAYGEYESRLMASTTEGIVVAIGETAYYDDYTARGLEKPVKIGDKVIFAKYSGAPVLDPDQPEKKMAVLNDEDVIAIIKSKEKTYE